MYGVTVDTGSAVLISHLFTDRKHAMASCHYDALQVKYLVWLMKLIIELVQNQIGNLQVYLGKGAVSSYCLFKSHSSIYLILLA